MKRLTSLCKRSQVRNNTKAGKSLWFCDGFLSFLHTCHCTTDQANYTTTVATILASDCAVISGRLQTLYWRFHPSSLKENMLPVLLSSAFLRLLSKVKASRAQNMMSLVGFHKRKWLKTTYTQTHATSAFTHEMTWFIIGCCASVDGKKKLSWKDFGGKYFL